MKIPILLALLALTCVAAERNSRIFGGNSAIRGQFPYHVKIEAFDGRVVRICNGALVRYSYVLTSADCIYEAFDIVLRFGMINRLEGESSAVYHITNSDHVIIHPNYAQDPLVYDVALLYLEGAETIADDPYVDVIELPTDDDINYNITGVAGNVTGFGMLNDVQLSMVLQYKNLPIISEDECRAAHGNSINYDDKFCTDGTDGSTCSGDEGAPFVTEINGRKVLLGIGSIPLDPCTLGWPPVFTNLLPHLDWIKDNVDGAPPGDNTTTAPPSNPDQCVCVCKCCTCPQNISPARVLGEL